MQTFNFPFRYSSFSEMTTSTRHRSKPKKRLKKRRPKPSSDTVWFYLYTCLQFVVK